MWHASSRSSVAILRTAIHLLPTGLTLIARRCSRLLGHVARLGDETPAHQALRRQIDVSVGQFSDPSWKRPSGRSRRKWLDQIRSGDNLRSPADLWRCAVRRGHSELTQRSQMTTRRRRQRRRSSTVFSKLAV